MSVFTPEAKMLLSFVILMALLIGGACLIGSATSASAGWGSALLALFIVLGIGRG